MYVYARDRTQGLMLLKAKPSVRKERMVNMMKT
jgi:hypothetical protein